MPALSLISHHDPSLHQTCPTAVVMSTSPLSSPSDARAQRKVAPLGPPAPPERSSVAPLRAKRKLSLSPESSPVLDADLFDPDLFPDAQIDDGEEPVAHLYTSSGKRQQRLAVQPHVPFVVGRHPRCDYVLDAPIASARHFKLIAHITDSGDAFVSLVDLSTNGTLLNGRRIDAGSACLLCDDDRIGLPGVSKEYLYRHASSSREEDEEVGDFRVLPRVLGTGTYASVRLAIHVPTGAQAACKRQNRAWLADAQTARNARREVAPNINSFIAVHLDEEHVYYFVSCVAGGDLFNYVAAHRRLGDAEAKFIFHQLRLAIAYLHNHGIAHRDIKPENVLLLAAGSFPHVQLGDFGLASDAPGKLQRASSQCGTVSYLPPEALRCRVTQESYDALAFDTWGAGVVLYVRTHPFDHCQLDTLDDVSWEVQAELLRRRLVTHEWLRSRSLLLAAPPAVPLLPKAEAQEAIAAADSRRQLVQNVFTGVTFDPYMQKMPCLAGELYPAPIVRLPVAEASPSPARVLLQQLLATDVKERISAEAAAQSEWLRHSRRELDAMYTQRVRER
ncbi:kinase-like protein [Tilletiopsis washingtonensis]|uniref:Kinase-like protein n=1 Tax=Tilletiopsis washingtonensis TaxID=58919 RepID=A0A316Z114_9BASI|nr:kinase-like protein [Tilletiopsis washingtonensis]PWN95460.1 kinase-like protein [Tilletiopsis washingtonensis]